MPPTLHQIGERHRHRRHFGHDASRPADLSKGRLNCLWPFSALVGLLRLCFHGYPATAGHKAPADEVGWLTLVIPGGYLRWGRVTLTFFFVFFWFGEKSSYRRHSGKPLQTSSTPSFRTDFINDNELFRESARRENDARRSSGRRDELESWKQALSDSLVNTLSPELWWGTQITLVHIST